MPVGRGSLRRRRDSAVSATAGNEPSRSTLLRVRAGAHLVLLQRLDYDAPLRLTLIMSEALQQLVDARRNPQRQTSVVRRALARAQASRRSTSFPCLRRHYCRMLPRSSEVKAEARERVDLLTPEMATCKLQAR